MSRRTLTADEQIVLEKTARALIEIVQEAQANGLKFKFRKINGSVGYLNSNDTSGLRVGELTANFRRAFSQNQEYSINEWLIERKAEFKAAEHFGFFKK